MKKHVGLIIIAFILLAGCKSPILEPSDFPLPNNFSLPQKMIYGLGEATHGSAEFTLIRQNVFAYLVEERGVRAFCLECDFGEGLLINSILNDSDWDVNKAIKQFAFWVYRNEEMSNLLNWIRKYNEGAPENDKIRFYGFDNQQVQDKIKWILVFIENKAPELYQKYDKSLLSGLDDRSFSNMLDCSIYIAIADSLIQDIIARKDYITKTSSNMEFDMLMQVSTNLLCSLLLRESGVNNDSDVIYGDIRDTQMADQIAWILAYEKQYYGRQSIFITGHNAHISKTSSSYSMPMGAQLKILFQDEYFAIGTAFGKGEFYSSKLTFPGGLHKFKIDSELPLNNYFLNKHDPVYFVDLTMPSHPFDESQQIYEIGSVFSYKDFNENMGSYIINVIPAEAFDGLLYFSEVHAFRRISR